MIKELRLSSSSGLGAVTIFTVLLILCLTVFSVLTLASAQADMRLTEKNALMVSSYYNADNEACNVSDLVTSFWLTGAAKPSLDQCTALETQIKKSYPKIDYVSVNEFGSGFIVDYSIVMETRLHLDVSIMMPESGVCKILKWQMTPAGQVIDEGSLSVWQGGMELAM